MYTCVISRYGACLKQCFSSKEILQFCLDLISWGLESFTFIDKLIQKTFKELDEGVAVGCGSYWRTVCMVLIGCRFDTCIDFLSLIKGDKAVERFITVLSSLDWNWLTDDGKIPKLDRWKHELGSLLTSGAFDSNRNILFLAQLLNGDRKNLERAASAVIGEWWHIMPFYTFVKNATVAYNELAPVAEECRKLFSNVEECGNGDFDPFLSIFCMKDISVLQNLISNPWLSVHLIDILLHTDSEYASMSTLVEIRDFLLMDYASGLIQNSWYLREEEWSAALSWALRGGRGPALDTAVNQIVWHAEKNELATLSLLDHLADYVAELESPSLAFLFNYYRFHRSLSVGDVRIAAPILVSLISSTNVPLAFHKILFGYLLLILADAPQVQIPPENLHELVSFFRQYSIDNHDNLEDSSEDTVSPCCKYEDITDR
ncbi:hypothetical protein NECAME_08289 [Necator americanus]|uniref:Nuclear pore complex protein Nup85 n=1 Tax=Necator americanus TaxID=51031 RepID=W2TJH9_NECAM|nr:hypothetical protein NECAME_08289 [Necator americanus]ETN81749.1 hypothetical protein NECAME_08289 [Necator americanus]